MAAGDTPITIIGNLCGDPELRYTPRYLDKQSNEWKDGDSLFLRCNVWRQAAENVAESLTRGCRVIVTGRLRQRSYETREGEKRTTYEIEVDEVGPSLRNASAKVVKAARTAPAAASAPAAQDDPWAGLPRPQAAPGTRAPARRPHRRP